ncbi:ATP-binding protein [Psychromonas ossibalaenae]|uniref:ATP-binding protein n=1 Tax=Psychromonas ossibalaenae TaxID=444922 RepID=UPI0003746982|nr:ATP-binding protein [Psychromonas ossibalaenae]
MKKLFILTYLFIVVTFFVAVILMDQSEIFSSDHWEEQSLQHDISAASYLLNEIALSHDQEYAEQVLEKYLREMHFKLTVLNVVDPEFDAELKDKVSADKIVVEDSDDLLAYFTFGNEKHIYKVELDMQSEFWQEESRLELLTLLEICAALALITFIVLFMLSRRLRRFEKACIAFADGDLDVRASTKMLHKVGNLNTTFNFMAERIGQLIRSNRNLTNAVAHEFRTPIFRIQCNLDMLDDSSVRPEQMVYLEGMQGDLNELCSMVEELLHFAKMERLDIHLILEKTDIHSLLDAQLRHLQFETDKKLTLETSEVCYASIAVRPFQRAVSNIIRNGYKYAQSEVRISLHKSAAAVHICIENDGPVIPLEDREAIFEPFIRLEKSRDRQSGGHGLGLAIVKQIIKQHKGRVYISDGQSGPCFNIILPLTH